MGLTFYTFLYVSAWYIIVLLAGHSSGRACSPNCCKISMDNTTAKCSGHGRALDYIPHLPCTVRVLEFINNYLPNITRDTFKNLTCKNITSLNLSSSRIKFISEDALSNFTSLTTLVISDNMQMVTDMLRGALARMEKVPMKTLNMSSMGWTTFPESLFSPGKLEKLEVLILTSNLLQYFTDEAIGPLANLVKLDLTHNKIREMNMSGHHKLQILIVQQNNLLEVPRFCQNKQSPFPALNDLRFTQNCIQEIDDRCWDCLTNLTRLTLRENSIRSIPKNAFALLSNVIQIDLEANKIKYLKEFALNNSHVKQLLIPGNRNQFVELNNEKTDIFNLTRNLTILDMSEASFRKLTETSMVQLFSPLKNLVDLRLRHASILILYRDVLSQMPRLRKLDVTGNRITSLETDPNCFSGLKNLEVLLIGANHIHIVREKSFPKHLQESLKHLDLSHNTFTCDCSIVWFTEWMERDRQLFKWYPSGYTCFSPNTVRGNYIVDFHPSAIECTIGETRMTVIIILCFFCIASFLIGQAGYRYRWNIRYWIYLCQSKKQASSDGTVGSQNFLYNAIVVHSEEDQTWVMDILVDHLEVINGYKLYVSARDCHPTEQEAAMWLKNMDKSRKVIFVLSTHFLRCDYCSYLTNVVIHSSITRGRDLVIPIYKEDTDVKIMGRPLMELLTNVRPPVWTTDLTGQQLFWSQVEEIIGQPVTENHSSELNETNDDANSLTTLIEVC